MRCLYVDLDGTLLGAGGAVTRDGEGGFTLLGIRALEACHRAGVLVCAMSGRPRTVLHDDARILGLDDYIFEAGGGFAVDDELHWLAEPDAHERIAASGAPDLLLERYRGRLEPHTPYSEGREVSHILRGHIDVEEARALLHEHGHDDLRLIDNGEAHHHSTALADLPSVRLYHLLPAGISKPAGVAAHMRARGLRPRTASPSATRARTSRSPTWSGRCGSSPTPSSTTRRCAPGSAATRTPASPRRPTAPASTRRW